MAASINTDEESICIMVNTFLKYQEDAVMDFEHGVWPYLKFFLTEQEKTAHERMQQQYRHNSSGYRRLCGTFTRLVIARYGGRCVAIHPRRKAKVFRLAPVYKEEECPFVMPWKSAEFFTHEDLVGQTIGIGKLAFTRKLWAGIFPKLPHLQYFHTGITLRRCDGDVDLMEVNKVGSVFKLNKKRAADVINVDSENTELFVDNQCLRVRGALDPKKTLYRISRILGKTVAYNLTEFNCDVIATWLLTGRLEWTTAKFEFHPTIKDYPGEIKIGDLLSLEENLQDHQNQ